MEPISFLITLFVLIVVLGLVYYLVGMLPIDARLKNILIVILIVIAIIVLLNMLIPIIPSLRFGA